MMFYVQLQKSPMCCLQHLAAVAFHILCEPKSISGESCTELTYIQRLHLLTNPHRRLFLARIQCQLQ